MVHDSSLCVSYFQYNPEIACPVLTKAFPQGEWFQVGLVPAPAFLAGRTFPACRWGMPVGSILWVKRVSSAVRLRFWPDVVGQALLCRSWRRVLGDRVSGVVLGGSLTVREVSFGGAWPGSRIRCDEGGHSGRFRLGRSGRVWSRRGDDRGDGPFGDGRQDAGPGFRPVDVVLVRREGDLNDRAPVVLG